MIASIYANRIVAWANKNRFTTFSIVALIILMAICLYLPLHAWRHPHHQYLYPYDKLGAWLQGALTPVLLAVALGTWIWQQSAARLQERQMSRSFLLESLHPFYGHLNYTAACALVGRRPTADQVPYGNLQCISILLDILHGQADPRTKVVGQFNVLPSLDDIKADPNYRELEDSLRMFLDIIRSADMMLLVDKRIRDLAIGMGVPT